MESRALAIGQPSAVLKLRNGEAGGCGMESLLLTNYLKPQASHNHLSCPHHWFMTGVSAGMAGPFVWGAHLPAGSPGLCHTLVPGFQD
jgi:hypothetical protein